MNTLSYKTISANVKTVNREWLLVDADGQTLGRLASQVARLIRGKHKVNFTPHVNCGDNVIVINSTKVNLTGNKWEGKEYVRHTGFTGGQILTKAKDKMKKKPNSIIEEAVKGMLPKNKLGNELFRNLYVYEGDQHNQEAQKPKKFELNISK